ncbi:peptide chain release factor N(5)-glutamine methyltransferase [Hippea alviniae]|uniref:peptide chain release factor N(5)-glutamine methyltransferase n=1 Tax=Hippea alviniae TaxID=1279027 RepID=UPI0003B340C0|nr:peptide chain release factor N(5)-glutamine methyltransferase [Hippea alviniae]
MVIRELLKHGFKELKESNIATYQIDTLLILKTVLGKDDVYILANPDKNVDKDKESMFFELLNRRKNYYPMAYTTKRKEFFGFDFYVDERVLIPRPETELLVEETIKLSKEFKNPVIIDVATGSGCIAISLSKTLNIPIFASDISKDAIEVAKINRDRLKADVKLIVTDKLSFLKKADIIVCNPPYIAENEYERLQPDVKFEPKLALIDKTGTQFLEELLNQAKNRATYLISEIGYNQLEKVKHLNGFMYCKHDLNNLPRVAVFKLK